MLTFIIILRFLKILRYLNSFLFIFLEALDTVSYSGGCINATKEVCVMKEYPLIHSFAIECFCKTDFCNRSHNSIPQHRNIYIFVLSVWFFNKWLQIILFNYLEISEYYVTIMFQFTYSFMSNIYWYFYKSIQVFCTFIHSHDFINFSNTLSSSSDDL